MTKRLIVILSSIILLAVAFTGCDLSDSGSDQGDTDYILSGYYWLAGDEDGVVDTDSGRASVNIWDMTGGIENLLLYPFQTLIDNGIDGNKVTNYPEQGQTSFYTVTLEDPDVSTPGAPYANIGNVYKIAVNTEFQKKEDIFDHYQEEYYVFDSNSTSDGSDGYWTGNDPIVTGGTGSWSIDSKARDVMELHYQDDSTRYEWIVSDSNSGEEFDHFIEDAITSIPGSAITPTATDMDWSSKVYFYQKVNNWVDFWYEENKEVYGIRYYTESTVSGKTYRTSISFERFVTKDSLSDISTLTDSDVEDMVFGDLPAGAETLSESVTWYEIDKNNSKKTTKTYATVNPTFADSFNIEMISEYDL